MSANHRAAMLHERLAHILCRLFSRYISGATSMDHES
jgi:hypothetical protein